MALVQRTGRHAARAGARRSRRATRSTARSSPRRATRGRALQSGPNGARRSVAARRAQRARRRHALARHTRASSSSARSSSVPGDVGRRVAIGPRVYIPARIVDETDLLRVRQPRRYETLCKLPPTLTPAQFAGRFRPRTRLGAACACAPSAETEFNLTQAIDQLRDFLSVIGLVALLLGGIGVASGVNAFVMRKIDTVADPALPRRHELAGAGDLRRCRPSSMGLVGAAVGALLGVVLQLALPHVLAEFLPVDVTVTLEPTAIAHGPARGRVGGAGVRAAAAGRAAQRVAAADAAARVRRRRAARRALDPLRVLVALARRAAASPRSASRAPRRAAQGLGFAVGDRLARSALLYGAAALLSASARRVVRPRGRSCCGRAWRASIGPGNQTRSVVLALGFGVFLMSTVYQVQHNLLRTRRREARRIARERRVLRRAGRPGRAARLAHPRRGLRRSCSARRSCRCASRRSTACRRRSSLEPTPTKRRGERRERLGAAPRVPLHVPRLARRRRRRSTAGSSTPAARGRRRSREVSVDVAVANDLRVSSATRSCGTCRACTCPTRVTSFREVNWTRFEPNFFVVFETRALAKAPKQFVVLADVRGDGAVARCSATSSRGSPMSRASTSRSSSRRWVACSAR